MHQGDEFFAARTSAIGLQGSWAEPCLSRSLMPEKLDGLATGTLPELKLVKFSSVSICVATGDPDRSPLLVHYRRKKYGPFFVSAPSRFASSRYSRSSTAPGSVSRFSLRRCSPPTASTATAPSSSRRRPSDERSNGSTAPPVNAASFGKTRAAVLSLPSCRKITRVPCALSCSATDTASRWLSSKQSPI